MGFITRSSVLRGMDAAFVLGQSKVDAVTDEYGIAASAAGRSIVI